MKAVVCWIDVISPYAWLAFERLPESLAGCSYAVEYRPVLFAGLLAHWGQKGPAEIEPKRAWTFRQVHWLAAQHGVELATPAVHPFNPLALLRLALACGPNRRVMEAVLRHVWVGGGDPNDPARLATLTATLQPALDPAGPEVKAALRANTEAALAAGVFGVPSFTLDSRVFWGMDSLPMLRCALLDEPWFDGADAAASRPPKLGGVVRTG
jgi:2-hydroxychromene-2-carboxylate isomerase